LVKSTRASAVATGTRLLDEIRGNQYTAVQLDSALRDELEYVVSYIAGNESKFEFDAALREARNIAGRSGRRAQLVRRSPRMRTSREPASAGSLAF
jgi:hypothetical protein